MRRWVIGVCVVIVALAALKHDVFAQRIMHRVQFGDTFTSLAQFYYGDKALASFIAQMNGRNVGDKLMAGARVRVPTAWNMTVVRRTSVKKIAAQLLGDARRQVALRTFNTIRGRYVRAGTVLHIPFEISHVVRRGETFDSIATRYYGQPLHARLIAQYNLFASKMKSPPPGAVIAVPIVKAQLLPQRLQELTQRYVLGISPARDGQREGLQEANALLREGYYWRVPLRLVRILAEQNTDDVSVGEVFKLLAVAYVALGNHALAVESFREALLRHPGLKLDAVVDSPKIIRAFVEAKAGSDNASRKP